MRPNGSMDDHEMLCLTYGALKASATENPNLDEIVLIVEEHLFPPKEEIKYVEKKVETEAVST